MGVPTVIKGACFWIVGRMTSSGRKASARRLPVRAFL